MNKTALLKEIDRIIGFVRGNMNGFPHVCPEAKNGAFEREIVAMVRRHIGDSFTMEGFLSDRNISLTLSNEYRILMLESMKKTVQKEAA